MRTRSKSTPVNPTTYQVWEHTYTGTLANGQRMLPIRWVPPSVPKTLSLPNSLPKENLSEISDEVKKGRGIKECTHLHRTISALNEHRVLVNAGYVRAYYNGPNVWIKTREHGGSLQPGGEAWNHAHNNATVDRPSLATIQSSWRSAAPDRLHELPAKVVRKLDELHLSTTLIESRELPQLWRLFVGRNSVPKLIDKTIEATTQSLSRVVLADKARRKAELLKALPYLGRSMRNFGNAYRQGMLGTTFGLLPTVRDAQQIAAFVSDRAAGIKRKDVFSVTIRGNETFDYPTSALGSVGMCRNITCSQSRTLDRVDGVRVTSMRPQYNTEIFNTLQHTIDTYIGHNPMGLVWEVLPLSFALDWVFAIDDMLDSLWLSNNRSYVTEYWSSTKIRLQRTVDYRFRADIDGPASIAATSCYKFEEGTSIVNTLTEYKRIRRETPNPLSSLRPKGAQMSNLFLSGLIAVGLRW